MHRPQIVIGASRPRREKMPGFEGGRPMNFKLNPLGPILGAEVTGLDLSQPLDAGTKKALHDAWVKHAVLVIRGQKLAPVQFARAAGIFGELLDQQIKKYM